MLEDKMPRTEISPKKFAKAIG
jgi:cytoskeleton-associated protein 5